MNLNAKQLVKLIASHRVHGTWCYGCNRRVAGLAFHLAHVILIEDELAGLRGVEK